MRGGSWLLEGSAGKTSLQKRLINAKAALPKSDSRTRGIEVIDWKYKGAFGNPWMMPGIMYMVKSKDWSSILLIKGIK